MSGPRVVADEHYHNLVVTSGKNIVRDLLNGDDTPLSHLGMGTSSTPVVAGQTNLGAEVNTRVAVTSGLKSTGKLTVLVYVPTTAYNGPAGTSSYTLWEAGLFTSDSLTATNAMFARVAFANAIVKTADICVHIQWDINIG